MEKVSLEFTVDGERVVNAPDVQQCCRPSQILLWRVHMFCPEVSGWMVASAGRPDA